jgi:poly [ADP-ribose] polymerase
MKQTAHLVMVTTANNNKYYDMFETDDGYFDVKYGRIGNTSVQTARYPMSQWRSKYNEKIGKGYVDQTRLKEEPTVVVKKDSEYQPIQNKHAAEIAQKLMSFASVALSTNYEISQKNVTQKMVDEAQRQLSYMIRITSVYEFNDALIKLFTIIPRRMSRVSDHLARGSADFAAILKREQDLLDVMAGEVVRVPTTDAATMIPTKDMTILDQFGLEMDRVYDDDICTIKQLMSDQAHLFHKAWKIKNNPTESKYQRCLVDRNIKDTKLLFHGSRNENFWNIVKFGLLLHPGKVMTTGSMFGHGLYFAPRAQKSIGYTSLENSYWARGRSDVAYLAIYEVAYGKPFLLYDRISGMGSLDYRTVKEYHKADCVHAKADRGMLRNDEIIVYKEDQATIRYLIEMKR